MLTVGVDVGGTTAKAGLVDGSGALVATRSAATPRTAAALDDVVAGLVGTLSEQARDTGGEVGAVGLAVAGFVDAAREGVSFGAHLPWRDEPVAARMSERLGVPVTLEHDANAAGLAEHRVGAAVGSRVTVLLALGTGVGAALLVDGTIFRGAFGVAPELGHLVLVPDGRPCPCGKRGCFERYCSGTALGRNADEMVTATEEFSTLRATWERGLPLTGREVAEAAAGGDVLARRAVAEFAAWLGRGLALIADVFDPDVVVLGGEVSASVDLFRDAAVAAYTDHVTGRGHRRLADVRPALYGGDAGMVGAALDARERCAPRV